MHKCILVAAGSQSCLSVWFYEWKCKQLKTYTRKEIFVTWMAKTTTFMFPSHLDFQQGKHTLLILPCSTSNSSSDLISRKRTLYKHSSWYSLLFPCLKSTSTLSLSHYINPSFTVSWNTFSWLRIFGAGANLGPLITHHLP
jgi:hypothetical protein